MAYHASLPTSPVLMPTTVVGLPVRPLDSSQATGHMPVESLPIPIAQSRDIFMADLDAVLANLEIAREWQFRNNNNNNNNNTSGGGGGGGGSTRGDSTPSQRRSIDEDPAQRIAQTGQLIPDALEAAMASLPPVRVHSSSALDSYATVTAQGLTPLTAPNSRAASLAASAASSPGQTPKDGQRSGIIGGAVGTSRGGSPRQLQSTNKEFHNARPPLPGKISTSGTSTPTGSSPSGIPPILPRGQTFPRASGVVARGGGGGTSANVSPANSKPPSPQAATIITSSAFTSTNGGGGGTLPPIAASGRGAGVSSNAAMAPGQQRPPSRLGGLRSGSQFGPPPVIAGASSSSNLASGEPSTSSEPSVVIPPLDIWPAIAKSESSNALAAAAGGGSLTGSVWGSLPASVRSGASTPNRMSPRASGNWAATAAASPVKKIASPKLSKVLPSPRKAKVLPPSSPSGVRGVQDPKFKLQKDEFPSLK